MQGSVQRKLLPKICMPDLDLFSSTSPELKRTLVLDGYSLTIEDLVDCSKDLCRIEVSFS